MTDFIQFWAQHAPVFSILIPAFTAFALVLLGNPGSGSLAQDWRQPWRRGISLVSALLGLITAVSYLAMASQGQISVYNLSEWAAPFGIVLVHNGNLTNAQALKHELFRVDRRHINTESDTEVLINVLAHEIEIAVQGAAASRISPAI